MTLQKRFLQFLLIFILAFVLSISYSRYINATDKATNPYNTLIEISKERVKSNVRFQRESMPKSSCTYGSTNFAIYDFDQVLYPFIHCIPMHTLNGFIPICVQQNFNEHITKHIKKTAHAEVSVSEDFEQVMVNNPEYDVIDIGAKIGIHSLLAANQKRLVFAVEPMYINAKIFHQTVILNRMETMITLVAGRPPSSSYEVINLLAVRNASASWTKYSTNDYKLREDLDVVETQSSETILLDDLLNAVPFHRAIMVLNADGNEAGVIRGGHKFFDCLEVAYVFMQWSSQLMNDDIFLFNFFSERNYTAYAKASDVEELSFRTFNDWPFNIVWKKNKNRDADKHFREINKVL